MLLSTGSLFFLAGESLQIKALELHDCNIVLVIMMMNKVINPTD